MLRMIHILRNKAGPTFEKNLCLAGSSKEIMLNCRKGSFCRLWVVLVLMNHTGEVG